MVNLDTPGRGSALSISHRGSGLLSQSGNLVFEHSFLLGRRAEAKCAKTSASLTLSVLFGERVVWREEPPQRLLESFCLFGVLSMFFGPRDFPRSPHIFAHGALVGDLLCSLGHAAAVYSQSAELVH